MSKMLDLGKKAAECVPTHEGDSAQVLNYPEFHVENDQLAIDGDHVGKHLKATVRLHVKGHEIRTGADGKETKHTHFALKGMQIHPGMEEGAEHEASESLSEEKAEHPNAGANKHHERLAKIKKDYIKGEE